MAASIPLDGDSYDVQRAVEIHSGLYSVLQDASVELLFFDYADAPKPFRVIELDPEANRTSHYWHISVPAIESRQINGLRVHGPATRARDTFRLAKNCCSLLMRSASPLAGITAGPQRVSLELLPKLQ